MKFIRILLITSILNFIPLNANSKTITSGIAAGVTILTLFTLNSKSECKPINYKNYIIGKKMFTFPAMAMLNNKFNACVSKVIIFDGDIKDSKLYKVNISHGKAVNALNQNNKYEINIATTIISSIDKMSGKEEEPLYIKIDKNGTVIEADKAFTNMLNKKLFTIKDKITLQKETFSQEIIYTGISGHELHLQYREYNGNNLKWPFTMNLIFDIKKSNIIQIKNYKIKIIEANNLQIIYKIL